MNVLSGSPSGVQKGSLHRKPATIASIANTGSSFRQPSIFSSNDYGDLARHARTRSSNQLSDPAIQRSNSKLVRADSHRHSSSASGTFAPKFIETETSSDKIDHIEGENDFSGKRYVWVKDEVKAFIQAWVVEEREEGKLLVQCDDGSVSRRPSPKMLTEAHATLSNV